MCVDYRYLKRQGRFGLMMFALKNNISQSSGKTAQAVAAVVLVTALIVAIIATLLPAAVDQMTRMSPEYSAIASSLEMELSQMSVQPNEVFYHPGTHAWTFVGGK